MSKLNGGYIMVDVANTTLAELKGIVECSKPILVYGFGKAPAFATGVTKTNDAVVIETAHGLVTVTSSGVATSITDLTKLTDAQCEVLEAGDVVVKTTDGEKHSYRVSYKKDKTGLCLTYSDASVVETVSYDYTGGHWVYNSTDTTSISG